MSAGIIGTRCLGCATIVPLGLLHDCTARASEAFRQLGWVKLRILRRPAA